MKIFHILQHSPISKNFVDFIRENFPSDDHEFVTLDQPNGYNLPDSYALDLNLKKIKNWSLLNEKISYSDKVIVHGFFQPLFILYLVFNRECLVKFYWVLWGADIYHFHFKSKGSFLSRSYEYLRKLVLSRVPNTITYVAGDFEMARKLYNLKMKNFFNILYPSNFFYENSNCNLESTDSKFVNLMIGNSADPANNHETSFKLISSQGNISNIRVYCPLSYGSPENAIRVSNLGKNLFGDKFFALDNLLEPVDYSNFLNSIDVAVFNYNFQQGMGNILKLLGMGKTVYLNPKTSQYRLFRELNIEVFSIDDFSVDKRVMNPIKNVLLIKSLFSPEKCLLQWKDIFERTSL